MNKLAIEPGFICFLTNLKLMGGGGGLIRGERLFDVWPS